MTVLVQPVSADNSVGPMYTPRVLVCAAVLAAMAGVACSGDEVGRLSQAMSGGNAQECESAAKALGAMGPAAGGAAPAMLDVVVKQRRVKGATCWTTVVDELPKLGPAATSLLLTALGDHRAEDAAYVLSSMGVSALPTLTKALDRPASAEGAASAIAFLGRAGAPTLGALRRAHKDGRLTERKFLASISWFASAETVPDFTAALRSGDVEVRWMATRALEDFVAESPEAVRALSLALQDASPEIRNYALAALSKAGPAARSAVPAVRLAAERRLVSPSMAKTAIARMR